MVDQIAALPAVARNDQKGLRHSLEGRNPEKLRPATCLLTLPFIPSGSAAFDMSYIRPELISKAGRQGRGNELLDKLES